MSIAQTVQKNIAELPPGRVFGYQELPVYTKSSGAVIKAINRLVSEEQLARLSKGKFYVPKKGVLGIRKPSDSELIRSIVYKDGRLRGYVTGLSLYNQLGLTTQVPRTVTVALNGSRQEKEFGTIRVRITATNAPVTESNVKLLQYLDVLKDLKSIPDSDINLSLKILGRKISELSKDEQARLVTLAIDYYSPQVRALVGLLSNVDSVILGNLKKTLNPTTIYKLKLDKSQWPAANDWNIR
jgi:hypothetical protein